MYKKTVTYTDYNGKERTEDFYFNFTKAEAAEMELSVEGGLEDKFKRIVASQDNAQIVAIFKGLVMDAYGVKSEDGKRFIKTQQVKEEFSQTEAYSQIFIELASNTDEAIKFVENVIPKIG